MRSPRNRRGAGLLTVGTFALVICCGGHLLLIGALGALTLGAVAGVAAGALALGALLAAVLIRRRRRQRCAPGIRRSR